MLVPIAQVALAPADQKQRRVRRRSSPHILMHELMHGLGPHNITVDGRATTRAAGAEGDLQRDRGGQGRHLRACSRMQYLIDKGVLPKAMEQTLYTTFLASAFRSIRFGVNEAHGKGQALQLNYLLDAGAVHRRRGRHVRRRRRPRSRQAVAALTREIMTIAGARRSRARAARCSRSSAWCGPR